MNLELKKRIITSILLLFLLYLMINYTYILIISLIIISVVTWIEFNSLIYKIFKKNKKKNHIIKFLFKTLSLIYLSLLILLILNIEIENTHLKISLIYSILVSIVTDIGGLLIGRTIKGKKLTKISPKKTISGSIDLSFFH
jgi:phosphatidate cytidylyltransferase